MNVGTAEARRECEPDEHHGEREPGDDTEAGRHLRQQGDDEHTDEAQAHEEEQDDQSHPDDREQAAGREAQRHPPVGSLPDVGVADHFVHDRRGEERGDERHRVHGERLSHHGAEVGRGDLPVWGFTTLVVVISPSITATINAAGRTTTAIDLARVKKFRTRIFRAASRISPTESGRSTGTGTHPN